MASCLHEQRDSKGRKVEPGQVLPRSLGLKESNRVSIAPGQLPTRGNPGKGCGCWYLPYSNPSKVQDQGADVPLGREEEESDSFISFKNPFYLS